MSLQTKNGILYRDGLPLSLQQADADARMSGLVFAEDLVKKLEKNGEIGIGMDAKVGVGVFVFNSNGHFILGKRKGSHGEGEWSLPGGHVEWMEKIENTVRRELEEETGINEIRNIRKIEFTEKHYPELKKHYITLFFACESDQTPQLKEPEKCEGWEYFSLYNLPEPMFCGTLKIIQEQLSKSEQCQFSGENIE